MIQACGRPKAGRGGRDIIRALLSHRDIDVNAMVGGNGRTALDAAVRLGHLDAVQELLKRPDLDVGAVARATHDAELAAEMPPPGGLPPPSKDRTGAALWTCSGAT